MKSKTLITLTAVFLYLSVSSTGYCKDNNLTDKAETGVAFEQALKNYENYKQKEQEELAKKLNFSLGQIAENWIAKAKDAKKELLGSRIAQHWESLALSFPIPPGHYEYYLRGYKYGVVKKDINKTDSIVTPYKAVVIIQEDLYAERNHSPDISDANPYFYTVSIAYNLSLEYRQDKFVLINTDNKIINIENDAPFEIKKFRLY